MEPPGRPIDPDQYGTILTEFLRAGDEESLYRASLLSQSFIDDGMGPEDIVAIHSEALDRILTHQSPRDKLRAMADSHQFLLEVMIAYGVRFKEYLELKLKESLRDAEAQIAHEQERARGLDRLQQEKGEIIGVIAHELRTPLQVVTGNIFLTTRLLEKGQIESATSQLLRANEALDRLSRLTSDLVEASREGRPSLKIGVHDLAPIVDQACTWAEPLAQSKSIDFSWQSNAPMPDVKPKCDPDALLSILGNILSNAIRYTPAGGRVVVRYGVSGDWTWIEVEDTGIGMSADVRERIFERFYRAPEARLKEARGLGLGLSLADQLVRAHNGRIEVESAENQGSTFRVVLPLSSPESTATSQPEETQHGSP